ncbi:MAG TPA: HAD-IA family hydrolase [Nocardioides sp.]|nr:HAD-IA family hydrolase [Nocardioides sp.]
MPPLRDLHPGVHALLCDADGNLFPSEEPAFDASAAVTNDFLVRIGSTQRWDAGELRRAALGRNFRALAEDLLSDHGVSMAADELDTWVRREQDVVTERLGRLLRPDDAVRAPLARIAARRRLALVSSSALGRLDRCLVATGLADLFPKEVRVSAQDSLPEPTSKPDPAVYLAALRVLAIEPGQALAVEDAVSGVSSAVGAGIPVVGNLAFVPAAERQQREHDLLEAGASAVVADWASIETMMDDTEQQVLT